MASGRTVPRSTASGRNLPVRTSAVFSPCCCAPATSASMSSPTIHVISASASRASSAGEIWGARLSDHRRLHLGRVLQAGDEAAESRSGPREVCHQRFLCRL